MKCPRSSIPAAVRAQLRGEVGFGCPVPGCRKPFLEWHHFDPPYREGASHNANGMIALCPEHHSEADGGGWSNDKLRAMKSIGGAIDDVKGSFPSWESDHVMMRIGTNWVCGASAAVTIGMCPAIALQKNPNGLLSLSLRVFGSDGEPSLVIEKNDLMARPTEFFDLQVTAQKKHVKCWLEKSDVGLDLTFERMGSSEVNVVLMDDLGEFLSQKVMEWVMPRVDSENRITVFDIRRFATFLGGERLDIPRVLNAKGNVILTCGTAFHIPLPGNVHFDESIRDQKLLLDDQVFIGCNIENCELQFAGGQHPVFFGGVRDARNKVRLVGPAFSTQVFITNLRNKLGPQVLSDLFPAN